MRPYFISPWHRINNHTVLSIKQNPPQLPPQHASVIDITGDWWIAHVKARNEKALAWDLNTLKIDYYLPLIQRETYSGDRRRKNLYPVFPSYMFFAGDPEQRYRVLQTNRVANILEVRDRDQFVGEISRVHEVLGEGEMLDFVQELPIGRRVEVARGPFKGTTGLVTGNRPWKAITLTIAALGVGAELKINGDLLELLDD